MPRAHEGIVRHVQGARAVAANPGFVLFEREPLAIAAVFHFHQGRKHIVGRQALPAARADGLLLILGGAFLGQIEAEDAAIVKDTQHGRRWPANRLVRLSGLIPARLLALCLGCRLDAAQQLPDFNH